ncbi:hypothetical protein AB1N83_007370 [Pleurotus pulmonarius]
MFRFRISSHRPRTASPSGTQSATLLLKVIRDKQIESGNIHFFEMSSYQNYNVSRSRTAAYARVTWTPIFAEVGG